MKLLLDECLPKDLLRDFAPHAVAHVKSRAFAGLQNGELLAAAQHEYDVLITVDANIYHQNKVSQFNLAVVVLRAYRNAYEFLLDTVPEALEVLQTIQPGQVVYVWADKRLRESDRRKGKGPFQPE
jgi:predicted nuclease of predicted toxin-antitoxin system